MKKKLLILLAVLWALTCQLYAQALITEQSGRGSFPIVAGRVASSILIDTNDFAVVKKAASLFQQDIDSVTGIKASIAIGILPAKNMIVIGTIGHSAAIDRLIAEKKIDIDSIKNKWEAYQITVVQHPFEGVDNALVIAGSDGRGTAYGMLTLSGQMGVSPLYYWDDVPVKKHTSIYYSGSTVQDAPAVKYRGMFINDEAPALSGWTKEKFGGVNHLFYEKVFELILRMKGNYLWPAMWGEAFNDDDTLNPKVADEYGIVMGTSHHEPLVRAHDEWRRYGTGKWNYDSNKTNLQAFWRKGIQRMGTHENIVTIGMRGDGDEPMSQGTAINLLERIVQDQRQIIEDETKKPAAQTPQLWALYKEVQDYYDKGMRVPDDVTLLLSDDNWGNLRKLPTLQEAPRAGGYGIYYHFDYVGDPRNYKWINTNPIARVWEQMHLAYKYGADKIWIVNVGDIKPVEFPLQFFLDFAWKPASFTANNLTEYTQNWTAQQFGSENAETISHLVTTYLQYSNRRKPELLSPDTYSLINYNEADRVLADYRRLLSQAKHIDRFLPANYKAAYYQLVLHPIKAFVNLNELYITVAKNRLYAKQGRSSANYYADAAKRFYINDSLISKYYNDTLASGKWSHMMDQTHIGYTYWQQPEKNTMPAVEYVKVPVNADMGIAVEGDSSLPEVNAKSMSLQFDDKLPEAHWIDIFNKGKTSFRYSVASPPYVRISERAGNIATERRIFIDIDFKIAPQGSNTATIIFSGAGKKQVVNILFNNTPGKDTLPTGFTENNGVVSIEASHYSTTIKTDSVRWQTIPHLGRTLSGISTFPVTAESNTIGKKSPHLEYKIYLSDTGLMKVHCLLSPTLPFHNKGLRYAISMDDDVPQPININEGYTEPVWRKWVADNIIDKVSVHHIAHPGNHVLKFWRIDAGVVLQKILIDAGGLKETYLGPNETVVTHK